MPPEPLPWDRKDFFKERRHERPPSGSVGPASRWRGLAPHNGFRGRPPGNGRPGAWRYRSAESGRGFPPSRVSKKFFGDEAFRPSGYHMDGYNRTNWEVKGSFVQEDFRGQPRGNGMMQDSYERLHVDSDHMSVDGKGCFGQRDPKGQFWENGELQNSSGTLHYGIDQRSFDDKGSFARKDWRGKPWENGSYPTGPVRVHVGENQSSVNGKGSHDEKDLKGHSWENSVLPNGSGRADADKDHGSCNDKGSFSQTEFRGKSCENGVLPNNSSRLHVGSHQSPVDDEGSICPKNFKRKSSENDALPNRSGRLHLGDDQGPVGDMPTFTTHPYSDSARAQDAQDSKYQYDKPSSANDLGPGRRFEKENSFGSIDWKPLKWTRLGSLSARASGFSHSSCAKNTDSNEPKAEILPYNATPVRSPLGDAAAAAACVTMSAVSFEDTGSRKKPRLRWGEGLAKVAKKKVEGHDDDSKTKPGLVVSVIAEHSHVSNVADKSPRVAGFLDCASPATTSLVACSPSPGDEDRACSRSAKMDYDTNYAGGSVNLLPRDHREGTREWDFCLENLEISSVSNLCSSPTELFQVDNPAVVNSSCVRSTAMIKLLAQKCETLKALEVTESEIDLLETDLKKLISDSRHNSPHPTTFSSLLGDCQAKPCENVAGFSTIPQHLSLQVISSEDLEKASGLSGEDRGHVRDEVLGTTTSKFVKPFEEVKDGVSSDLVKNVKSCDDMDIELLGDLETGQEFGSSGRKIEGLPGSEGGGASLSSDREEASHLQILALNKDTAIRANEVFDKLLPSNNCSIDASRLNIVTSWKDDPWIMQKFAYRKFCRRFQDRVNALKFRVLHHLWKEDLQLLSVKKKHAKIQKRLELCLRLPHSNNQKHRSSRSHFSSAGGLVPTAKIVNFTRKLLSDSQVKPYRDVLKMPALIVDKETIALRFISNNGLVEDPCAFERERAMINPWTKEEQDIFMDKLAVFGKDFQKISSFLDHKTTADCVEFYYKNHKSDCFVKLKKKPDFRKQGKSFLNNYLVTSGKRWNRETNAASLDVLGEALAVAGKADYAKKTLPEISGHKAPQNDALTERPRDLDVFANERETEAADVLAGICGSISSEAMSSCITSSFDRGESYRDLVNQKVGRDDETTSDDSCGEIEPTHWTDEEKSILVQAVSSYGTDFAMISRRVGTKSRDQCKVFFSKARKCLGLDTLRPKPSGEGIPCEDDNNGGGSDSEVACVMETDSVVGSKKSTSKGNKDVLLSDLDMNGLEINDCKAPDDSEKISSDDLMDEDKPEVNVEGNVEREEDVDNEPLIAHDPMINVLPLHAEEDRGAGEVVSSVGSVSAEMVNDHGYSVSCAEVGVVDPLQGSGEPRADYQEMISGNNLTDKQDGNDLNDKQDTNRNSLSNLNCDIQDSHDSGYELNLAADSDAVAESGVSHKQDKKITLNPNPPLESPGISLEGDDCPVSGTSVAKDVPSNTQVDFERITDKCNESASADTYTQCQPSPSVFVGHPLQVAANLKVEGDYCSMYGLRECFLWKCNGSSNSQGSVVELPFHSHAQNRSYSRHHSGSSSAAEKPSRNGDVKLFGQILTHSPSQQEQSNENVPDNEDKSAQYPKPVSKNVDQKLTSINIVDSTSVIGKTDSNNYICLENFPRRSFGFWDGNKKQTGFTSFPNSDIILAKYPAAFGNFSSLSNIEQPQALNSVVKSNDHKLNAVSVFTSRERKSGNGLVDYQLYRNQQDKISALHRHTGTGAFSSLRNSIGVVGTNVGISDPVAAIKIHYAKVEQYGGQAGSIMLEEEPWRGKAVGR